MASLKELRTRLAAIHSTRRITSAMKMVAAAKLRRAQIQAEQARPFADRLGHVIEKLVHSYQFGPDPFGTNQFGPGGEASTAGKDTGQTTQFLNAPPLLRGNPDGRRVYHIVVASDRGLCGGFNHHLMRRVQRHLQAQRAQRAQPQELGLITVGRRASLACAGLVESEAHSRYDEFCKPAPSFIGALALSQEVLDRFEKGEISRCEIHFNRFVSALTQTPTRLVLIPYARTEDATSPEKENGTEKNGPPRESGQPDETPHTPYTFEPDESELLAQLLPANLATQIYGALLESFASEQAARMTAMDNATRNAGTLIHDLTLTYNRVRQAAITKELIEIISGAEAL